MKLFEVCKQRGIPVITVINKWDRPGLDALALMDEIQSADRAAADAADLAGRHRRRLPRRARPPHAATSSQFTRTAGGATRAPEERIAADAAAGVAGDDWDDGGRGARAARPPTAPTTTRTASWPARPPRCCSPRRSSNFGVAAAARRPRRPAPRRRAPAADVDGAAPRGRRRRSARFVFKVQAGMNTAHRDRRRLRPGLLRRLRARHGRHPRARPGGPSRRSTPRPVFGREREVIDDGLPRRHRRPGQRLTRCGSATPSTSTTPVEFPPIAELRPRALRGGRGRTTPAATSSSAAASSSSTRRASSRCCARTCAATRPRCWPPSARCSSRSSWRGWRREFNAPIRLDRLDYTAWPGAPAPRTSTALNGMRDVEVLQRTDGTTSRCSPTSGAPTPWRDHPDLMLEPLLAGRV